MSAVHHGVKLEAVRAPVEQPVVRIRANGRMVEGDMLDSIVATYGTSSVELLAADPGRITIEAVMLRLSVVVLVPAILLYHEGISHCRCDEACQ